MITKNSTIFQSDSNFPQSLLKEFFNKAGKVLWHAKNFYKCIIYWRIKGLHLCLNLKKKNNPEAVFFHTQIWRTNYTRYGMLKDN